MSKPIPKPSKEEVIDYYINTTVTAAEAAKHFGMSEVVFRRLLRAYDVHKSPK